MTHKTKLLKIIAISLVYGIASNLSNRIWRL